jgi:hypothetical protein
LAGARRTKRQSADLPAQLPVRYPWRLVSTFQQALRRVVVRGPTFIIADLQVAAHIDELTV